MEVKRLDAGVPAGDGRVCLEGEGRAGPGLGGDVGQLRAVAGVKIVPAAGEMSALYVLRSRQGLGLGRALLEGMFAQHRLCGLDSASLWVLEANLPARSFYARLGGQVVAEKLDHRAYGVVAEVAYGWRSLTVP